MAKVWDKVLNYIGYDNQHVLPSHREREENDYYDEYRKDKATVRKLDRKNVDHSVVRPINPKPMAKVHILQPKSFNDAKILADKFKKDVPVIVNLQNVDKELAKRLIDFASGLTYGLDGAMKSVSEKVFLLTPYNVSVSAEDRQLLQERGLFFNQS